MFFSSYCGVALSATLILPECVTVRFIPQTIKEKRETFFKLTDLQSPRPESKKI